MMEVPIGGSCPNCGGQYGEHLDFCGVEPMNFVEVMATNPPRLVVMHKKDDVGGDLFQWGVVGAIPVLGMIGAIERAKAVLVSGEWMSKCDEHAMAIVFKEGKAVFFTHQDIPTDPLVGMLTLISSMLTDSRKAQQQGSNVVQQATASQIVGTNGRPINLRG